MIYIDGGREGGREGVDGHEVQSSQKFTRIELLSLYSYTYLRFSSLPFVGNSACAAPRASARVYVLPLKNKARITPLTISK